jgi:hypothetical protein
MKVVFSRQIFEKVSNIKFHQNSFSGSRVIPCGRTDITKLIVVFRNFVNAPRNGRRPRLCYGIFDLPPQTSSAPNGRLLHRPYPSQIWLLSCLQMFATQIFSVYLKEISQTHLIHTVYKFCDIFTTNATYVLYCSFTRKQCKIIRHHVTFL